MNNKTNIFVLNEIGKLIFTHIHGILVITSTLVCQLRTFKTLINFNNISVIKGK